MNTDKNKTPYPCSSVFIRGQMCFDVFWKLHVCLRRPDSSRGRRRAANGGRRDRRHAGCRRDLCRWGRIEVVQPAVSRSHRGGEGAGGGGRIPGWGVDGG